MLVLSRKVSQQIQVGPDILITVVKIDRNQVRLGISAPEGVTILREELLNHSQSSNDDAVRNSPGAKPVRAIGNRYCTLEFSR